MQPFVSLVLQLGLANSLLFDIFQSKITDTRYNRISFPIVNVDFKVNLRSSCHCALFTDGKFCQSQVLRFAGD